MDKVGPKCDLPVGVNTGRGRGQLDGAMARPGVDVDGSAGSCLRSRLRVDESDHGREQFGGCKAVNEFRVLPQVWAAIITGSLWMRPAVNEAGRRT